MWHARVMVRAHVHVRHVYASMCVYYVHIQMHVKRERDRAHAHGYE